MNSLKKVFRMIQIIEWICLVVPVIILVFLVFAEIVLRMFSFRGFAGFPWLEEFSRYVLVFATFLGASIAIDTDSHPKMTALLIALPSKVNQLFLITGDFFCSILSFYISYYGYVQMLKQIAAGARSTALPIPMFIPYMIIPIGLFTSGIRYLFKTVKGIFINPKNGNGQTEMEAGAKV